MNVNRRSKADLAGWIAAGFAVALLVYACMRIAVEPRALASATEERK